MERLTETKTAGLNSNALRKWGMFFCALGIVGRGLIQNHILGIGTLTVQQLLEMMQASQEIMVLATVSLVLQAMETCAAPIFALLLVEGFLHTSNFKRYLLRVAGLAVLCQIPYSLAMGGSFFDGSDLNPVFGMFLGLVMLYFYRRYAVKNFQNVLIKAIVTVAALIWALMLKIEFGVCMVVVIGVMWAFRKKPLYRNLIGAMAAIACSLVSPFFLAASMGFLAVHKYNGEREESNRWFDYLAYPVMLLAAGLLALVLV